MKSQIHLSFDEGLAIERILKYQSERAKHAITLSILMDKWSQFVIKIEKEYQLTIDDYTNSLSIRNHLEEVLNVCPENESIKAWIDKWDNRLINVTHLVKEPLLPPLNEEKIGWWWYRIPANPGNILKKWFQMDKSD